MPFYHSKFSFNTLITSMMYTFQAYQMPLFLHLMSFIFIPPFFSIFIQARVSKEQDNFLINPFGLLYHEVTASSLIKVDSIGNIIDHGTTSYGPNLAGFTLHSAIHNARPDVKCILHAHTPVCAAVSFSTRACTRGGGGHLHSSRLPTRVQQPLKWILTPCYVCSLKWSQTCKNPP